MSVLTDAMKTGDAAAVARLLDADPSLLQSAENGVTPILFACYIGKPELARLFTKRGARLTFAEACALGEEGEVERQLDADPSLLHSPSADGFPPLGLAIFFRHPALARLLIERGADVNAAAENAQRVAPLHAAAAVRDRETMQLLLERGADPNARQQLDYTPLHGAASRGDTELAELLLTHGADRDARAADGMTPADVARKYGQDAFAEWLARQG
ncbi:MAG: ankyrin repeat domain-containing protein [Acidobacteria bacterium]|nr:ankyrin repeat domain-containing protein [Acidobacteriota bacterium]MBV9478380.1 ankyrin repeat domain-containing protein [Acidobacteriota bacterium]